MKFRLLQLGGAALLALFIAGCGEDGQDGQNADPAVLANLQAQVNALTQSVKPEQCALCHTGSEPVARTGPMHQAIYKEFYQDGIVQVLQGSMSLGVSTVTNANDTTTLTFQLQKRNPATPTGTLGDFDCQLASPTGSIGGFYDPYDSVTRRFGFSGQTGLMSLKPGATGITYNPGTNVCTWVKTFDVLGADAQYAPLLTDIFNGTANGVVSVYGVDQILETNPAKHMNLGKYPFAGILKIGTVSYASYANVSGCENCHTQPFLKHAYIYGSVTDNAGTPTQFYTCKTCHSDERNGGHRDWQILKDDPARFAQIEGGSPQTAEEQAKYAYKTRLMNDVHMSHNMEFAYPQRLTNCVTCHAGNMDPDPANPGIFAEANFRAETCISCHSLTDPDNETSGAKRGAGIVTMMQAVPFHLASYTTPDGTGNYATLRGLVCTTCHDGSTAPTFATLHNNGFDPMIYATDGTRYSDNILVSIDSASIAGNTLTIGFSATGTVGTLSANNIVPTVLVGLYGYDTKDFIVAAHGRDANNIRLLEYKQGDTNPRFTMTNPTPGTWSVTVDLTMWASMLADGSVKRAEISVLPELRNAANVVLGLDAPSKTFNFASNAFETYFGDIVKVKKTGTAPSITGCNTCHDQLATTFHSGIRGGNIRVCRTCHEVSNAGSHLELQSRSIDSYVHAIHSFQAFDPGDIDFTDPVAALEYSHHIGTEFPRFGILNCESCHNADMYNVPNQSKSMPGVLSGTDAVAGRNIGSLPPSVTGPAVRACGGCHRAHAINADDPGQLATLYAHWRTFGYIVDAPTDSTARRTLWETIVAEIMGLFS